MPACVVKEPNPTADRARIVEVFHLLSFESVGCVAPAAKKLSLSSPDPGLAAAAPAFFVEGFGREEDASSVRWLGEVVQDFRGDATHGIVTPLTPGPQVLRRIVGRIVIQVGDREHHL